MSVTKHKIVNSNFHALKSMLGSIYEIKMLNFSY